MKRDRNNVYDFGDTISSGVYGTVYRGLNKETKQEVAIKKVFIEENGASEEIRILKRMAFMDSIVHLQDCYATKDNKELFFVFDLMKQDLYGVLNSGVLKDRNFSIAGIKMMMKQLIYGIRHCHEQGIIHCDLKPSNILFDSNGNVKIGDFGISRFCNNDGPQDYNIVTQWYRCPELLLHTRYYGCEIDMWSIGCIFYELLTSKVLYRAKSENERQQLTKIFFSRLNISKNKKLLEYYKTLPMYNKYRSALMSGRNFDKLMKDLDEMGLDEMSKGEHGYDLLSSLLRFHPNERITALSASVSPFFWTKSKPKKQTITIECDSYYTPSFTRKKK